MAASHKTVILKAFKKFKSFGIYLVKWGKGGTKFTNLYNSLACIELRVLCGILIFVGYVAQAAKSAYGSESIVLPLFTFRRLG